VRSNTSDTITFADAGQFGANLSFTAGDTFQLWKVTQTVDQPGRSGGSLVTGDPTPAVPSGWNDQTSEPCYQWNNTYGSGSAIVFSPQAPVVRSGEHYIDNGKTPMPGYTPYTYPHPLISGANPSPAPPGAPQHLRVSGP
jgi:hypothetical protein